MSVIDNLEQYRIQRQNRKKIRQGYLKQLQTLSTSTKHSQTKPQDILHRSMKNQQQLLQQQNCKLITELVALKNEHEQKYKQFHQKYDKIRNVYVNKIKQISIEGKKYKQEYIGKSQQISQQIQLALHKSNQLQKINKKIQEDLQKSATLSQTYSEQIQEEYSKKLLEFEEVLQRSNQKIKSLEAKMDNEDIVQATLTNEELIQQIRQSAQKTGDEVYRIYQQYVQLLEAKEEIIGELRAANKMKEKELADGGVLESKLKNIVGKLGEERDIYFDQNRKMTQQLSEIQQLLMKVMGGALQ